MCAANLCGHTWAALADMGREKLNSHGRPTHILWVGLLHYRYAVLNLYYSAENAFIEMQ